MHLEECAIQSSAAVGFDIRPLNAADRDFVVRVLTQRWASTTIVTRGRAHQADELPGLVAVEGRERIGLVTYRIDPGNCEIVSLNSLVHGKGVGTALIEAVKSVAASAGCARIWLVTTNDNVPALRFYQKMDFVVVAVHRNALEQSRRLKPEIPEVGIDGIPIRDEIELEMQL